MVIGALGANIIIKYMENFVVSARKYRPSSFDSVIGQDHITSTLKNAIRSNQLAQAYLFCGPRGVGKTTCARILAKAINCTNPTAEMEPCNECESCKSFNSGASMNILELDAASNNSVDDIRLLVEQVRIPPQTGRYKVFIIDEVHMLSQAAFNAFLKTLEEPPSYVKFILATTERHKIMPTILSRCQCFDFKSIGLEDIVRNLKHVAESEQIAYEPDALTLIAKQAQGGMRDALSIFDQMVSFGNGRLDYKECAKNLNVLSHEDYLGMVDMLRAGDIPQVMLRYQDIYARGINGQHFLTGMSEHVRNLLVAHDPQTYKLLAMSDDAKSLLAAQSVSCGLPLLLKYLEIASDFEFRYKEANNKRLFVEVCLMKMAALMSAAVRQPQTAAPVRPS